MGTWETNGSNLPKPSTNSEAVLLLVKRDHNPITSTLLSMLYLSGTALTLTVGAAWYKWSDKKLTLMTLFWQGVQQLHQLSRMFVQKDLITHTAPLDIDDALPRNFMCSHSKFWSFVTAELKMQPGNLHLFCVRWWEISLWPWAIKCSTDILRVKEGLIFPSLAFCSS